MLVLECTVDSDKASLAAACVLLLDAFTGMGFVEVARCNTAEVRL